MGVVSLKGFDNWFLVAVVPSAPLPEPGAQGQGGFVLFYELPFLRPSY